jgi:hypothetical protein
VSSMNSTLTWVTPPREPAIYNGISKLSIFPRFVFVWSAHTGSPEDSGDFNELDRNLARVHLKINLEDN